MSATSAATHTSRYTHGNTEDDDEKVQKRQGGEKEEDEASPRNEDDAEPQQDLALTPTTIPLHTLCPPCTHLAQTWSILSSFRSPSPSSIALTYPSPPFPLAPLTHILSPKPSPTACHLCTLLTTLLTEKRRFFPALDESSTLSLYAFPRHDDGGGGKGLGGTEEDRDRSKETKKGISIAIAVLLTTEQHERAQRGEGMGEDLTLRGIQFSGGFDGMMYPLCMRVSRSTDSTMQDMVRGSTMMRNANARMCR